MCGVLGRERSPLSESPEHPLGPPMLAEAREVKAVEGASRVGTAANPRAQGLPRAWKMAARGTQGLVLPHLPNFPEKLKNQSIPC